MRRIPGEPSRSVKRANYDYLDSTPMVKNRQVILHLSDIHFGCDKSESARALRQLALDGITSEILKLDPEWRPTILCLSGDIAYRGKSSEYEEAAKWLAKLLKELSISPDHVVICAGNHDIDRNKVTYDRPVDAVESDKILSYPLGPSLQPPLRPIQSLPRTLHLRSFRSGRAPLF